jgi:MFS family permease
LQIEDCRLPTGQSTICNLQSAIVLGVLWLVCFCNYADRLALSAVLPPLKQEFGFSDYQLGWLSSSFLVVYALAVPLTGYVADRRSRKVVILAGLLGWSLLTYLTALAKDFNQLLIFRGLTGLGEAFYFPAAMSLLSDYWGPETRSRALSVHQTSVYAGTIGGASLAGYIAQFHGWRSAFTVFGGAGLLVAALVVLFVREPERSSGSEKPTAYSLKPTAWRPEVAILMAAFVAANFVAMGVLAWLPKFVHDRFGAGLGASGTLATAGLQTASLVGVLVGGVLADTLHRRTAAGRAITMGIGLVLGIPFLVLCGLAPALPWFLAGSIGFGLAKGLYDSNIFAGLYDYVPPAARASAAGLLISVGYFLGSAAPVLMGWLAPRYGIGPLVAACSLVYAGGAALIGMVIWRTRT